MSDTAVRSLQHQFTWEQTQEEAGDAVSCRVHQAKNGLPGCRMGCLAADNDRLLCGPGCTMPAQLKQQSAHRARLVAAVDGAPALHPTAIRLPRATLLIMRHLRTRRLSR